MGSQERNRFKRLLPRRRGEVSYGIQTPSRWQLLETTAAWDELARLAPEQLQKTKTNILLSEDCGKAVAMSLIPGKRCTSEVEQDC